MMVLYRGWATGMAIIPMTAPLFIGELQQTNLFTSRSFRIGGSEQDSQNYAGKVLKVLLLAAAS